MNNPHGEIARLECELFKAQLLLGIVEGEQPGLVAASRKRWAQRMFDQFDAVNPYICDGLHGTYGDA